MTQEKVAARLQTTVCTYRGWERNQRNASVRYMPAIIEFLGYVPCHTEFENLGQKIRAYRQLLGLRQKDLALQLGVDATTVGYLERGEHKPTKRLTRAIDGFFSAAICVQCQYKQRDSNVSDSW